MMVAWYIPPVSYKSLVTPAYQQPFPHKTWDVMRARCSTTASSFLLLISKSQGGVTSHLSWKENFSSSWNQNGKTESTSQKADATTC
jgi:hypothetical protein